MNPVLCPIPDSTNIKHSHIIRYWNSKDGCMIWLLVKSCKTNLAEMGWLSSEIELSTIIFSQFPINLFFIWLMIIWQIVTMIWLVIVNYYHVFLNFFHKQTIKRWFQILLSLTKPQIIVLLITGCIILRIIQKIWQFIHTLIPYKQNFRSSNITLIGFVIILNFLFRLYVFLNFMYH